VALSKDLVSRWLAQYMFAGQPKAKECATVVVNYLADHNQFLSHGRRVDIETLSGLGARVRDIRAADADLWQRLESFWYAVQHTFDGTNVVKMWENSKGNGFFNKIELRAVPVAAKPAKTER
jgi:hypothetical protein